MHPDPKQFIGKRCQLDYHGKRYAAVIVEAEYIGLNPRGRIPDYRITVRGPNRTVTLPSMADAYVTISDD